MNTRRSFFKQLALGAAAFTILPAAETYSRIWKPKAIVPVRYEINPAWVNAEYEVSFFWGEKLWPGECKGLVLMRKPSDNPLDVNCQYPPRHILKNGKFEYVHPFIPA